MSKIVNERGEMAAHPVPKIKSVKPVGSNLLVEIFTQEERLNTKIKLMGGGSTDWEFPQGIILAAGPGFKGVDWGFNIGDRVLMASTGAALPAPKYDDSHREKVIIEPHFVKAVLVE